MGTISEFLSRHHRDCDELYTSAEAAVVAGDWDAAASRAGSFRALMTEHFAMEEEVLFPAFEEATGMVDGPPAVMRAEHEQMRQLLAGMNEALEARDSQAWLSAGETLLVLIQQHNMKEEGILYPMADQSLSSEGGEIVGRMTDLRDEA